MAECNFLRCARTFSAGVAGIFFIKMPVTLLNKIMICYILYKPTGNSAAGSASGLGPGCRGFKSLLPEIAHRIGELFYLTTGMGPPTSCRPRSLPLTQSAWSENPKKLLSQFFLTDFRFSACRGFKSLLPGLFGISEYAFWLERDWGAVAPLPPAFFYSVIS